MPSIYVDNRGALPLRAEFDLYPTQRALIRAAIPHVQGYRAVPPGRTRSLLPFRILDPGAGDGRWGLEAKRYYSQFYTTVILTGVDIRDVPKPDGYDHWFPKTDLLTWDAPFTKFHLSTGNPPFNIAEEVVRLCYEWSNEVTLLLPRDFGGGIDRFNDLHKNLPVFQECPSARRPSFSGDNKTGGTVYSMWNWRKGQGEPNAWMTRQFNWELDPADIIPVAMEIRRIRDKATRQSKKNKQVYLRIIADAVAQRLVTPTFTNPEEEKDFLWRLQAYYEHVSKSEEKEDVQESVN